MIGRGVLTDKAKDISQKFLGREITVRELRLYLYLDYCMKNSCGIDRQKTNDEEQELIKRLSDEGHVVNTAPFKCTKDFLLFYERHSCGVLL